MGSKLSSEIIEAYRSARYKVTGTETPFVLHVDEPSAELASLLKNSKSQGAAFITVDNPQSQIVPNEQNLQARRSFLKEMEGSGLRFYLGVGEDPAGQWPGEQSFLVLGLSLEMAKKLGNQYGQNAILWAGHDGKPELILLR
jgi:hypothetical protein